MSKTKNTPIRNFQSCAARLAEARCPAKGTALGKNVRLWHDPDLNNYHIRYHSTDIVTYYADGTIGLNNGGWSTSSTKAWMCGVSPFFISQKKGLWFIRLAGLWVPYVNNMRININSETVVGTA